MGTSPPEPHHDAPEGTARMRTALAVLTLIAAPAAAAERPDIVVFLADDLGWSDCSLYGGKDDPHAEHGPAGRATA